MFEGCSGRQPSPQSLAHMDALAEEIERRYRQRTPTNESVGFVQRICAAARIENQAAAAQLVALGELFAYRFTQAPASDDWAIDTMAAVAAEVAAGLRIGQRRAVTLVEYARAMRERLPKTAEVFIAGDIDFLAFSTIVYRTDLIENPDVLAKVDKVVAANVARWPSMSRGRLSGKLDAIVARIDLDAVRRRKERQTNREIYLGSEQDGISRIEGSLYSVDAHALDIRLNELAATVCGHDPRTAEQRRADALGALAAGADRLGCRCGLRDCAAGKRPAACPVTIHVIADQATLTGASDTGAWELGADGLIPPELIAELATTAKLVPLVHPGCTAPEPQYIPSKALADFVRCRDLTCRWPGCDVPAVRCDLDHTIPYDGGGPTHAGNLKCYCRTHHLTKTFWGWKEQQLADGTLILTSPAGTTHVTTPGSALLFPSLCYAVGGMPTPETDPRPPSRDCGNRAAMMPKRRRTRTQNRAARVATERRANRNARTAERAQRPSYDYFAPHPPPGPDDEPPPF
ncbi:MAG: HNH endonuclease [Mycobacterium sp.]|uniref:HNH endonuclease signature motif containing protein n=1 Tax=Mycobacterium sp. TaxID=1785 RepID=UPI001EC11B46|nr:HNH endonuclease signature motif containing protein [Mycobacterium sp.]MBW0016456.1 HNH endonuclease [Mycobacterium sp.]